MSNPNSPYGFRAVGLIDGSAPNFGVFRNGRISPSNTHKIFYGDVLLPQSGGFFDVFTSEVVGGAPVGGVADGYFSWQSVSARMTIRQNWWTGNPSDVVTGGQVGISASVRADTVFQVRTAGTSGAAVGQSAVGQNANFTIGGGGNTLNGISSMALDDATIGSGASLPFRIYGLVLAPETDPTSIYNEVLVVFNNLSNP